MGKLERAERHGPIRVLFVHHRNELDRTLTTVHEQEREVSFVAAL
jgi:hypothetical protein